MLADGRLWRWAKESSMKFFSLPLSTRNLAGALLSWPWKIMRALPVALRWKVRQSRGGQAGAEGKWQGAVAVGLAVAETTCEASRRGGRSKEAG